MAASADTEYEVVRGIDYPPNKRKEPGQTVKASELPDSAAKWLLEGGAIKRKRKKAAKK